MADLLLKDFIDFSAKRIDELKEFKNPILEAGDGPLSKLFLNQIVNRYASPLIPDDVKTEAHEAQLAIIESFKDGILTEKEKENIALQLVDIPEKIVEKANLNEGVAQMVRAAFQFIDGVLKEVIK